MEFRYRAAPPLDGNDIAITRSVRMKEGERKREKERERERERKDRQLLQKKMEYTHTVVLIIIYIYCKILWYIYTCDISQIQVIAPCSVPSLVLRDLPMHYTMYRITIMMLIITLNLGSNEAFKTLLLIEYLDPKYNSHQPTHNKESSCSVVKKKRYCNYEQSYNRLVFP